MIATTLRNRSLGLILLGACLFSPTVYADTETAHQLLVIDAAVAEREILLQDLEPTAEVLLLNEGEGLERVAQLLQGRSNLDAIHLISHGETGRLLLGGEAIDASTLESYSKNLKAIGAALGEEGDLLLYGCDVAQGIKGREFIHALSLMAHSDVAASTNATGRSTPVSDWNLEMSTGPVEVSFLSSASYPHLLATGQAGQVDMSFGSDAYTSVTYNSGAKNNYTKDVYVYKSGANAGKILTLSSPGSGIMIINRFNADGSLDTSFNSTGKLEATNFGTGGYPEAITIDNSDRIVIAGYSFDSNAALVAVRLNSNGSYDTTFDTDGKVLYDIDGGACGGSCQYFYGVSVQSDNKIVIAGSAYYYKASVIVRLNENGSLDTTFDGDGHIQHNFIGTTTADTSQEYFSKATVSGSYIYAVGGDNTSINLARINQSNGSFDATFGNGGFLTLNIGANAKASKPLVQSDGKIVVAVPSTQDGGADQSITLFRATTTGTLDTTFGTSGYTVYRFSAASDTDDSSPSLVSQSDGKLVLTAHTGKQDIKVVRFSASGALDTTFGDGGVKNLAYPHVSMGGYYGSLDLDASDNIYVTGVIKNSSNTYDASLIRLFSAEQIGAMSYQFATTLQPSNPVTRGEYGGVLKMIVATNGQSTPVEASSFTLNTTGTTSTADLANAVLYYTGESGQLDITTATQVGGVQANPNGTFTITGTQALTTEFNYFWLAYQTQSSANLSNVVDGQVSSITVGGSARTPSITGPVGAKGIIAPASGRLYWGDGSNSAHLRTINDDGTGEHVIVDNTVDSLVGNGDLMQGVALDTVNGKLYAAHYGSGNVTVSNLDGSAYKTIVSGRSVHSSGYGGIAVHPTYLSTGRLFYTQSDATTISLVRSNLDGTSPTTIVASLTDAVHTMQVDEVNNKIYWLESDSANGDGALRRANLDGTAQETLATFAANTYATGLALDVENNKLYYATIPGWTKSYLMSRALDGTGETTVADYTSTMPRISAMALDKVNNILYWIDIGTSYQMQKTDLASPATHTAITTNVASPYGDGATGYAAGSNMVLIPYIVNSAPTADTVTANNVTQANAGQTSYTFTIAYNDVDGNFDGGTIGTSDVTVTGGATISSASYSGNASSGTATYTVTPPGGTWDDGDNGTYTIAMVASQVGDDTPAYVAANASAGSFTVSMDTTAPAAPSTPDMTAGTDLGNSSTDNLTSDTTPSFTGTSEANATVSLISSVDGTLGTTSADGAGNWTYTAGSALSAGAHNITATASDAAGNTSAASAALAITIDVSVPSSPSTPDMTAGTDLGSSNTDDLTSDTTPTFIGTAEANATVTVISSVSGSLGSTSANGTGNWSYTAGSALTAGAHNITATATNAAGNVSTASAGLAITIDASAPAAPSTPDMTAGTDSGSSSIDNVTSDITPSFTGTAEANATVAMISSVDGGVGSTTADGAGNWSITASALSAGGHNITATATDVAGNVSAASAALVVTIDASAPAAPSTPDMTAGTDLGGSSSDDLTSDTTPSFTGTSEANATVSLISSVDGALGSVAADGAGSWTITASVLSAGAHNVTAIATDAAGNTSTASAALAITLDATGPAFTSSAVPSVAENTTAVVTVAATDANGPVTYALNGGTDAARFQLVGADLSFIAAPNFEVPTDGDANNDYLVTVRATDNAGVTSDQNLTVTVSNVNDAPTADLDGSTGGLNFTTSFSAGGAAVLIANTDATVSDVDAGAQIASMTVTLTNEQDVGLESLSLNAAATSAAAGLTVTGSGTTALSITGASSPGTYQTILRGVLYNNTDAVETINTVTARTINVVSNDGTLPSTTAVSTVNVVTAPVVSLSAASYTEGDGSSLEASTATITEPDGDNLNQLLIELTNAQDGASESITLSGGSGDRGGITVTYNSDTQITVSKANPGEATASFQALLRELQYANTSEAPDTTTRTITVVGRDVNGNSGATATLSLSMTALNDAPVFSALDGTPTFTEEGTAAVLDANVSVADAELDAANSGNGSYDGATLTLMRNGAANTDDLFSESGNLSILSESAAFNLGGGDLGTVTTHSGGILVLTFNASATAANVDEVLQSIAYSNASNAPDASVQIDWAFSDGNSGGQGSGGALEASGSTTVSITGVNDAPVNSVVPAISGSAGVGGTLSATSGTWSDADGDTLSYSYQWKADGIAISAAVSNSYMLTSAEAHKSITVSVTADDSNGSADQTATSASTAVANSAPANGSVPVISGTAAVGNSLSASTGNWYEIDGDSLTYSYQWKRDGVAISGASASTYTLTSSEAHADITVAVTVDDGNGSSDQSATSVATTVVNTAPSNSAQPVISGTATVGGTLNTTDGTWSDVDGDSLSYSYQWKADGSAISGATANSYTLTATEAHAAITVDVTSSDGNGGTTTASSAGSSVGNTAPSISGTPAIEALDGKAYSFSPTSADVDGDSLTFSISNKPTWASFDNATGTLSGTPAESDIGTVNSGIVITVSDGTDSTGLAAFELTVNASNKAPTISGSPETGVGDDVAYSFTPTAADEDGDTLTFSITNKPLWASFSTTTGTLSGIPASSDVGTTSGIVIMVSDGSLSTSLAAFELEVYADNDNDNIADSVDPDDDNDGMSDEWEDANGLNSRDASDANVDADGDGVSNIDEYSASSDPQLDDYAPTFTAVPTDVTVDAEGLFTVVALGTASASDDKDGEITPTSDAPAEFSPGVHTVTWSATDAAGNSTTATQTVNVNPQVSFSKDQQSAEGGTTTFRVILNGEAVTYPVSVPYTVGGTAATDGSDHDLAAGNVTINSGTEVEVSFNIVDDGAGEGVESIVVTMGEPTNAVNGPKSTHSIEVYEGNVAPLISLAADQGGMASLIVAQDGGNVTVLSTLTDPNVGDTHTYDWSGSDNALVDSDGDDATFTFNPADLSIGLYTVKLVVSDGEFSDDAELLLNVIASAPLLGSGTDSDGDGSNDADEGYGDDDSDGVANYLDAIPSPNVLQEQSGESSSFLIETEPGLRLQLGKIAFQANQGQAAVIMDDVGNSGDKQDDSELYDYPSGLFDFTASELPVAGQSVNVVVAQLVAIPAQASYRKLMAGGWQEFVVDYNNAIASAAGAQGFCPPPGDDAYTSGLTEGHWCVQLTIEDGGPNDADALANNSVEDPGGVVQLAGVKLDGNASIKGSGGSLHPLWLLSLWLLGVFRLRRASARRQLVICDHRNTNNE